MAGRGWLARLRSGGRLERRRAASFCPAPWLALRQSHGKGVKWGLRPSCPLLLSPFYAPRHRPGRAGAGSESLGLRLSGPRAARGQGSSASSSGPSRRRVPAPALLTEAPGAGAACPPPRRRSPGCGVLPARASGSPGQVGDQAAAASPARLSAPRSRLRAGGRRGPSASGDLGGSEPHPGASAA